VKQGYYDSQAIAEMNAKNIPTSFWGEITDPSLENEYRQRQLPSEILRAKAFFIANSILYMLLSINDHILFGTGHPFWNLMVVRVLIVITSISIIASLSSNVTPHRMNSIMLWWSLPYTLSVLYIDSTRPVQFQLGYMVDIIVVLAIYVAVNTRLVLQTIPAVLYSIVNVCMLVFKVHSTGMEITSTVAIIVSANIIGFILSLFLNRAGRQQFLSLKAEEALREQLEMALTEIKTLEGLLPICSYCRMIRDGDGTWKGVEQYLGERSGAKFSSGVCPSCEKKGVEVPSSRFSASG